MVYGLCEGEPVPAAARHAQGGGGEGDGASLRTVLLQSGQKGTSTTVACGRRIVT